MRAGLEPVAETKRGVAGDGALALDDLRDAVRRHRELPRQFGRRDFQFGQFVGEDFAGMGSRAGHRFFFLPSMIIEHPRFHKHSVIAGLDPAIHPLRKRFLRRSMDTRVKPAYDAGVVPISCPGRGAAFFMPLRRAGTPVTEPPLPDPGSAARPTPQGRARCASIRGTTSSTASFPTPISRPISPFGNLPLTMISVC